MMERAVRTHTKSRSAFTLVELLVVIAIIGLLSTVAVVSLGSARARGKAAKTTGDLKQIATALQMYVDTNGGYPCFDHSFSDAWETTFSAPYLKWPKSPYGSNYHWEHWAPRPYIYSISIQMSDVDAQALTSLNPGLVENLGGGRYEWFGMDQALPVPIPETCP